MTTIPPLNIMDRVVDKNGIMSVEFKAYQDSLLSRMGGITGGTYNALTEGSNSISWDVDQNPVAVVTLPENATLQNPTNMVAGLLYRLTVVQDSHGSRTLSYGSAYKFPSGTPPTLTTSANAVDEMWFSCDGNNMKLCVLSKDIR
jgi:hypothetical protein